MHETRRTYARLVRGDETFLQPCVNTPLSARIAERLGFPAISLGGFALGAALGVAEPLLSAGDVVAYTASITRVTNLPLMVDGGTGFGDSIQIADLVRRLEHAGAAAVHIEDQVYPKRAHYFRGIEHIVELPEMLERIDCAVRARTDENFLICARTDALLTDSYDEAVSRANAFVDAGADLVMVFPNDEDETRAFPRDVPGVPLVYVNSPGNTMGRGVFSRAQFQEWGWRVVYDSVTTTTVSTLAVHEALLTLRSGDGSVTGHERAASGRQLTLEAVGIEELYQIEERTVEAGGSRS
jgi:methylisocitrate lyase